MDRLLTAGLLAVGLALAACSDAPPPKGPRSVGALFEAIDHGPLFQRREAVRELKWATVSSRSELERVLSAALQNRREILRDSARAAPPWRPRRRPRRRSGPS